MEKGSKVSLGTSRATHPNKRISNRKGTVQWLKSGTDSVYLFELQMYSLNRRAQEEVDRVLVLVSFDENDAEALKTIFEFKRFGFFATCLKLLTEFVFVSQVKREKLIQNFSAVKNRIMGNLLRCLDLILIQQSVKILRQRNLVAKPSEYLVKNSANMNEEKHFLYDPERGMIFHGEFLSDVFAKKVEEIWIRLNHFKIKVQRFLSEIKLADQNLREKVFILDHNHNVLYSSLAGQHGFGHFHRHIQRLETNFQDGGDSTLENCKLTIADLFPRSKLKQAIYELVIKLRQTEISVLTFPELRVRIQVLLDVQRKYQNLYVLSFDRQMLVNCSRLFDQLLERISQKLSRKQAWQAGGLENKRFPWRVWENNNQQFIEASEKSSIYTNESGRTGSKLKNEWIETLSGFNRSNQNLARRPRLNKTSISSNLINLSMISKNPEVQKSIVMEYVPSFLNQNLETKPRQSYKSEFRRQKPNLVVLKSIRNLKNLDCGKSMFFKEPFNPNMRELEKLSKRATSNEDNRKLMKGYSSNIVSRQNRFNTFSKPKFKRVETYQDSYKDSRDSVQPEGSDGLNDSFSKEATTGKVSKLNKSTKEVETHGESLNEIKNRKRHSTFGRISIADQEKIQKLVPMENQFQNDFSSNEESDQSPTADPKYKKLAIKDSDKNIFEMESDTKLSQQNLSSKALIRSISEGKVNSAENNADDAPETLGKKEEDMAVIREKVSEYNEDKKSQDSPVKDEGEIFFRKQMRKSGEMGEMHSLELISKSIELEEASRHSRAILKDIERDALSQSKFSLKNLFGLKRFLRVFGRVNRRASVGPTLTQGKATAPKSGRLELRPAPGVPRGSPPVPQKIIRAFFVEVSHRPEDLLQLHAQGGVLLLAQGEPLPQLPSRNLHRARRVPLAQVARVLRRHFG